MIRRGKEFCLDTGFYLDDRLGQIMVLGAIPYSKTISSTAAENSFYMGVHWVLVRLCPRMHQNSGCLHLLNSTNSRNILSSVSKKTTMSINDAEVKKQVSICSIFSTFYSFVISVSLALHVLNLPARVHTEGRRRFCCRSNI